jgi:hypothetical protein
LLSAASITRVCRAARQCGTAEHQQSCSDDEPGFSTDSQRHAGALSKVRAEMRRRKFVSSDHGATRRTTQTRVPIGVSGKTANVAFTLLAAPYAPIPNQPSISR